MIEKSSSTHSSVRNILHETKLDINEVSDEFQEAEDSSDNPLTPKEIVKTILKLTGSLTLTDTFAFRNICLPFLATRVDNSHENTAAIALILPMISTTVMGLSVLFSLNLTGSKLVGELKKLPNNSPEWDAKRLEIVELFRSGLLISSVMMPLCTLPLVMSGGLLHNVFQQDKQISYLAQDFLRPYSALIPAAFAWMCSLQMSSSFHYTKLTHIGPSAFCVGLFFAIVLGSGDFGMPKWGMMGILSGYGLEAYLTALAYMRTILYSPDFCNIGFRNVLSTTHDMIAKAKEQFVDGSAIAITVTGELLLVFFLSLLSGLLGIKSQEAFALVVQYIVADDILIVNAAVASAMVLGNALGSQKHDRVYNATRYGLWTSLSICSLIPLVCMMYPQVLMTIFNNSDTEVNALLKQLTPYISSGLILNALSYVCIINSRVFGDRWASTYERTGSLLTGVILASCLLKFSNLGIQSIGVGYLISMILSASFLYRRCNNLQTQYQQSHATNDFASHHVDNDTINPILLETGATSSDSPLTQSDEEASTINTSNRKIHPIANSNPLSQVLTNLGISRSWHSIQNDDDIELVDRQTFGARS